MQGMSGDIIDYINISETKNTPETVSPSIMLSSGAAGSAHSDPATAFSATTSGFITILFESAGGFAMAAMAEEGGRSETVQQLSSENDEDIHIFDAKKAAT